LVLKNQGGKWMENKTNIEWRLLDKLTGALHLDNRGEFIYELCFLRYVSIKAFKELANQESVNIDDIIRKYNNLLNSTDKYSYFENCIENIDLITDTVKEIEKYVYSINNVKEIVSVLTSYSDVIIKNIMNYDLLCNEGIRGGYDGTPEQICRIVNLFLDINKNDDVLDICSSYGNFLVNVGNCCSYKSLTGIEINAKASLISKIRLASLGFKSNIINMDLFSLEYNKKYDKILCDYPWGMRFDRMTQDYLSYSKDRMKFDWKIASGSGDWYFINVLLTMLKENGKGVVLLPAGPLFKTIDENFRKELVNNGLIEAVVKIPSIRKYTSIEQYALVISNNNETIKFIDISKEISGDKFKAIILMNKVFEIINNDKNKNISIKTKEELANNGYILKVDNYVGVKEIKYHNPKKLSNYIIDKYRGYQMTSKEVDELADENGEYEILTISDIDNGIISTNLKKVSVDDNRFERYLVKENDIIITSKGTRIKIAVVSNIGDRKIVANGNLIVLRIDTKKLNPYYLASYPIIISAISFTGIICSVSTIN
jgi:type I restriction enzyme M protein